MKVVWIFGVAVIVLMLGSCAGGEIQYDDFYSIEKGIDTGQLIEMLDEKPEDEMSFAFTGDRALTIQYPYEIAIDSLFMDEVGSDSVTVGILVYQLKAGSAWVHNNMLDVAGSNMEKYLKPYAFVFIDDALVYWGLFGEIEWGIGLRITKKPLQANDQQDGTNAEG